MQRSIVFPQNNHNSRFFNYTTTTTFWGAEIMGNYQLRLWRTAEYICSLTVLLILLADNFTQPASAQEVVTVERSVCGDGTLILSRTEPGQYGFSRECEVLLDKGAGPEQIWHAHSNLSYCVRQYNSTKARIIARGLTCDDQLAPATQDVVEDNGQGADEELNVELQDNTQTQGKPPNSPAGVTKTIKVDTKLRSESAASAQPVPVPLIALSPAFDGNYSQHGVSQLPDDQYTAEIDIPTDGRISEIIVLGKSPDQSITPWSFYLAAPPIEVDCPTHRFDPLGPKEREIDTRESIDQSAPDKEISIVVTRYEIVEGCNVEISGTAQPFSRIRHDFCQNAPVFSDVDSSGNWSATLPPCLGQTVQPIEEGALPQLIRLASADKNFVLSQLNATNLVAGVQDQVTVTWYNCYVGPTDRCEYRRKKHAPGNETDGRLKSITDESAIEFLSGASLALLSEGPGAQRADNLSVAEGEFVTFHWGFVPPDEWSNSVVNFLSPVEVNIEGTPHRLQGKILIKTTGIFGQENGSQVVFERQDPSTFDDQRFSKYDTTPRRIGSAGARLVNISSYSRLNPFVPRQVPVLEKLSVPVTLDFVMETVPVAQANYVDGNRKAIISPISAPIKGTVNLRYGELDRMQLLSIIIIPIIGVLLGLLALRKDKNKNGKNSAGAVPEDSDQAANQKSVKEPSLQPTPTVAAPEKPPEGKNEPDPEKKT